MPGMSGKELCARFEARRPDMKCLYLSGYTADVIANRGVLPEGLNFLHKPYTLKALAEKVRAVLDGPLAELAALADHTRSHFADEEAALLAYGYPNFNQHKKAHDRMVQKTVELEVRLKESDPDTFTTPFPS